MNLVVISGVLSRDPYFRTLQSGDELTSVDITVRDNPDRTEVVPVVAFGNGKTWRSLEAGDEVVISGRVRKRFFQANGALSSRTEVEAERVARRTNTKSTEKVFDSAIEELNNLAA